MAEIKDEKKVFAGIARANALSAEERSSIARKGAEARWGSDLPKAKYPGTLTLGETEIPCYVLEDGTRVITRIGVLRAIGRTGKARGGRQYDQEFTMPVFLAAENLKPYISEDLTRNSDPILFVWNGNRMIGYKAEFLPQVCQVFLDAKDAGALNPKQVHIAEACKHLYRAFATVGIIALIDEATGYQYERPRRELEEYLKKFLAEGLRRWVRTFPGDYFKHLCRLKGVQLRPDMKLPKYFGHLTNDLVWRRIAPGLLRALKERREERGRPSNKLFQWTSDDLGKPELLLHLGMVVGLMKIHTDYDAFREQLNQVAPVFPESPTLFDDPKDWESPF